MLSHHSITDQISKWVTSHTSSVGYLHYGTLNITSNTEIVEGYKACLINAIGIQGITFEELIDVFHRIIFSRESPKDEKTELFKLLIMGVSRAADTDENISFRMLYHQEICTFHLSRFRPCYGPSWEGPPPNELIFSLMRLNDLGNPVERVILTTVITTE